VRDGRVITIGLTVVITLCVLSYFYVEKKRLSEVTRSQADRLSRLEREKARLNDMVSEFSVDPGAIRKRMEILRETNKDCQVCHSGGVSCKSCHEDFEGKIKTHRKRVELPNE